MIIGVHDNSIVFVLASPNLRHCDVMVYFRISAICQGNNPPQLEQMVFGEVVGKYLHEDLVNRLFHDLLAHSR